PPGGRLVAGPTAPGGGTAPAGGIAVRFALWATLWAMLWATDAVAVAATLEFEFAGGTVCAAAVRRASDSADGFTSSGRTACIPVTGVTLVTRGASASPRIASAI